VDVVRVALDIAEVMCKNSPDALIVGRMGVRMGWEAGSVEDTVSNLAEEWYPRLVAGPNFAEGIQAFVEKRSPSWRNSKL
jgi:enoyl-CoA hydratase/carnithine racemase